MTPGGRHWLKTCPALLLMLLLPLLLLLLLLLLRILLALWHLLLALLLQLLLLLLLLTTWLLLLLRRETGCEISCRCSSCTAGGCGVSAAAACERLGSPSVWPVWPQQCATGAAPPSQPPPSLSPELCARSPSNSAWQPGGYLFWRARASGVQARARSVPRPGCCRVCCCWCLAWSCASCQLPAWSGSAVG